MILAGERFQAPPAARGRMRRKSAAQETDMGTGASPEVQGIDVSHYQGVIDWNQVAEAGTAFVFIKATEGTSYVDPQFQDNWSGAKAAGLLRGAYHFFQPGEDPQQQAEYFLSVVQTVPGDLPPVL